MGNEYRLPVNPLRLGQRRRRPLIPPTFPQGWGAPRAEQWMPRQWWRRRQELRGDFLANGVRDYSCGMPAKGLLRNQKAVAVEGRLRVPVAPWRHCDPRHTAQTAVERCGKPLSPSILVVKPRYSIEKQGRMNFRQAMIIALDAVNFDQFEPAEGRLVERQAAIGAVLHHPVVKSDIASDRGPPPHRRSAVWSAAC